MKTKAILGGLILALAGLGIIFLGCGGAKQAEPYVVGGIFSISGPASYLGEPERNSLEMVVEGINAQGGINGHPVKLAIYDDEGDVTKARLHATKLAQDKDCLAVIGPSLPHPSMAALEITQKTKLPLISCAAGSAITSPANERVWVFKTAQTDKMAVERIYQYLQKHNIKHGMEIKKSKMFAFIKGLIDSGLKIVCSEENFPEEERPALMAGCKFYCLPSFWEGFGIEILSAFGCGKPVVVSNIGSIPETAPMRIEALPVGGSEVVRMFLSIRVFLIL